MVKMKVFGCKKLSIRKNYFTEDILEEAQEGDALNIDISRVFWSSDDKSFYKVVTANAEFGYAITVALKK